MSNNNNNNNSNKAVGAKPSHVDGKDWEELQRAMFSSGIGGSNSGVPLNQLRTADPSQLGNDPGMELEWAEKAGKHAETYFKILKAMPDKSKLKLTPIDNQIYKQFREKFPKLDVNKLDEEAMKSPAARAKWRPLLNSFENNDSIQDWNFGTLIRVDSKKDYSPDNVQIVVRILFLIIEIARNKEGANNSITKDFKEQ